MSEKKYCHSPGSNSKFLPLNEKNRETLRGAFLKRATEQFEKRLNDFPPEGIPHGTMLELGVGMAVLVPDNADGDLNVHDIGEMSPKLGIDLEKTLEKIRALKP